MNLSSIMLGIGGLVITIIMGLLALVHKMHTHKIDAIDQRESDNNKRHIDNYKMIEKKITEERRIAEARDSRIFEELAKVNREVHLLNINMATAFVNKNDCVQKVCRGDK